MIQTTMEGPPPPRPPSPRAGGLGASEAPRPAEAAGAEAAERGEGAEWQLQEGASAGPAPHVPLAAVRGVLPAQLAWPRPFGHESELRIARLLASRVTRRRLLARK